MYAVTHQLRYHYVFVTWRHRRILVGVVAARTRELLTEIAQGDGCEILDLEVFDEHVVVGVAPPPELSPRQLAWRLRNRSAQALRAELGDALGLETGALWARDYLVSVDPVDAETREAFVRGLGEGGPPPRLPRGPSARESESASGL